VRLLAVTTSFPLRKGSSAGVFVQRLYEHLPEHWRVTVICPDDDGPSRAEDSRTGRILLHPVRYAPRRWRVLAQQAGGIASGLDRSRWRIALVPCMLIALWWRCLAEARRADVVHANWAICGAIAAAAAVPIRRPLVTTLRGDDVTKASSSVLHRRILAMAVGGSVAVICVSEAMAAALRALYPERARDVHVCLNGVDRAFLSVHRSPPVAGRLRVASVGSLIRRKGYDVLIEAMARARCRAAIGLRIAGAGPELAALREQAARLDLSDRVEFTGELPPAQVPRFLAGADVFVLPSRSEGRPNAVIEALAAGLPVISSDLPGVEGLVEHGVNGWRVQAEDVAALASALDEANSNPGERERRAVAARSSIREQGASWAETGAAYDALFRGVLSKLAGSPA
jgi:glycosyltransferase involved in cell wall biosynthesis